MARIAYISNDNLLTITGLRRADTAAYINDATCTVTVKDVDGTEVSGASWPVTLSYVSSSNGNYRGTLPYGASLTEGVTYVAHVAVNGGSGLIGAWELRFTASRRDA